MRRLRLNGNIAEPQEERFHSMYPLAYEGPAESWKKLAAI